MSAARAGAESAFLSVATPTTEARHPAIWLIAVAAVAGAGEFYSDRRTEQARRDYSGAQTSDNFHKWAWWEGTRNTFPAIYLPAITLGVGWWGYDRLLKRRLVEPEAKPLVPSPVPTAAPPTVLSVATPSPTPLPAAPIPIKPTVSPGWLHFEKGVSYYEAGNKMSALLEFTKTVDADPDHAEAHKWIDRINAEMSAPRPAPTAPPVENKALQQQQRVIEQHLKQGFDLYNKGQFKKAIERYKLVLDLVGQHTQAAKLLSDAQSKLDESVRTTVSDAQKARDKGDLAREIAAWKSVLTVDDENERAKKGLADAQGRVKGEVNRLYRRGLDLYGAGKIEEAVSTWQKVLDLDPDHERAKLALEKADRKLQEIKAAEVGK